MVDPIKKCAEHNKRVAGHRGRRLHPDDEPKTWCQPDYRNADLDDETPNDQQ